MAIDQGEVARLQLSLLPNGKTRLHFDIDLLVADVQSFQIILRDLAAAYSRQQNRRHLKIGTSQNIYMIKR